MRELNITIPGHYCTDSELSKLFGTKVVDQSSNPKYCPPTTNIVNDQKKVLEIALTFRNGEDYFVKCPECNEVIIIPRENITKRNIDI